MPRLRRLFLIKLTTLLYSKNILAAEGMPQFNSETFPSQLFWLVVTFVILYLCMNFLVLPRIRANIRLRKNKISNDLERAELLKEQIDKTLKEYNDKILQAKNQANENIKNALEKANYDLNLQIDNVKKRIAQKINKVESDMEEYKKNMEKEISNVSASVSYSIIVKVIGKELANTDVDFMTKNSRK